MEKLYIDESGSMTVNFCDTHPFFIISIIKVHDARKMKKIYKRFVSKNLDKLRKANARKGMFKNGKFSELKGSSFTPQLKREFVKFFCRNNYFELFYIVADNRKIEERLYSNTAKAFNYFLRLALEHYIKSGYIVSDAKIYIQIDERNERTDSRHFLANYLNTELYLSDTVKEKFTVSYFDSANNSIIQIADVFANLLYSQKMTGAYDEEFAIMEKEGYLKNIFEFPLREKRSKKSVKAAFLCFLKRCKSIT